MRRSLYILTLLLLVASVSAQAQTFGRLFTTPAERARLDRLRNAAVDDAGVFEAPQAETTALEPEPAPVLLKMGGTVLRSDGSYTIWLNDSAVHEAELPADMWVERQGTLAVLKVKAPERLYTLKAGQTLNLTTGELQESWRLQPVRVATTPEVAAPSSAQGEEASSAAPVAEAPSSSQIGEALRVFQQLQSLSNEAPDAPAAPPVPAVQEVSP